MSEGRSETIPREIAKLHAYHDGELSRLGRWRFERTLRRRPALRRELAALDALRESLRVYDAEVAMPDLWDDIALRLPAVDARRAEGSAEAVPRGAPAWLKPVGALAATAALALVIAYGTLFPAAPSGAGAAVRWIDSGDRSVMVLDDEPDTTIIWVLDGTVEGASRGGSRAAWSV